MVHIIRVDLTTRGVVLPSDRVGMVMAQPHLCLTEGEPFVCLPNRKGSLMSALRRTLDVSRANHHGLPKTHFTIFPEYSIPGIDGADEINEAVSAETWPVGTIVIGGVDALTKAEFQALANRPNTHLDDVNNAPARVAQAEWVNCGVTWVKAANGVVEKWLQPKIAPAWEELNISHQAMFRGNSIFAFKGTLNNDARYRFSSLLCFDWIASIENRPLWRWVIDDLHAEAGEGELSLSWFFVIQKNPQPSHATFLGQVPSFFDAGIIPNVRRERTCLVFANSAGRDTPGRSDRYGGASLIFTRNTRFQEESSRPTVSKGGIRFRNSEMLGNQRDAYFREKGACIHSFVQANPDQAGGANARVFAVERPYVFPVDDTVDPRLPSDIVPGCVKWMNDELDITEGIGAAYPDRDLTPQANTEHAHVLTSLRQLDSKVTCNFITLSTPKSAYANGIRPDDADQWGPTQIESLNHVVHTITLMRVAAGAAAVAHSDRGHATVTLQGESLDLVAIRGKSHQECRDHASGFAGGARRKVLFVTRDRDNTQLGRRAGSFLQPQKAGIGQEQKVTDPDTGKIFIDYQSLLQLFQTSDTQAEMQGGLNAQLAA